ncbi:MAG: chemotaxis protein CheW [Eubacteriales bacterium]|nr:chemotaxis protein CheW [Eubacteriales bacterium]
MEEMKYIVFQLGQEKYGMNLSCVSGIEKDYRIIPVPNAPECVDGIINLRGTVIPVYSLKKRFKMSEQSKGTEKSLLVTLSAGTVIAYEVDVVLGIEQMEADKIVKMPDVASNQETTFLDRILRVGNDIVLAIDVNRILSQEMTDKLNKFVENQQ